MKKFIAFILSIGFIFSIASCSKGNETGGSSGGNPATQTLPTYSITASAEGGSIVCDKEKVTLGESLTVTLTPEGDKVLYSLTVNGGEVTAVAGAKDGVVYYTWTAPSVLGNYTVKAVFCEPNVTVSFDANGGNCDVAEMSALYGKPFGVLPQVKNKGKKFLGWFDGDNKVNASTLVKKSGTVSLKAKWEEFTEEEIEGVTPYAVTTTLYDSAATAYGVVWATEREPFRSVMQLVEKSDGDYERDENGDVLFDKGQTIDCAYEEFQYHYISTGVLDNLKFNTTYLVRLGDLAADNWSDSYEFTTREEAVETTKFLFIADTQEDDRIGNRGSKELRKNGEVVQETYFQNVLKDATARFPDAGFIAHGGDFVNYGADDFYMTQMIESIKDYVFKYPMQLTSGNHEGSSSYGRGWENVSKLFHYDSKSERPVNGDLYSFNYGRVHFVVLRSNDIFDWGRTEQLKKLSDEQLSWLKNDLKNVDRDVTPWVVCMMHEAPISFKKASYAETMGPQLFPILTQYDVDLMLFGHNHITMSSNPIAWDDLMADATYYGNKLTETTTAVSSVLYDGVTVDKFDFTGVDPNARGTVFHQTACGGYQFNATAPWANRNSYQLFRSVFSGDSSTLVGANGVTEGRGYSMYSYIEATETQLVLRTYGVDVKGLATDTTGASVTDFGVYLDGFMLNK